MLRATLRTLDMLHAKQAEIYGKFSFPLSSKYNLNTPCWSITTGDEALSRSQRYLSHMQDNNCQK